MEYDAQEWPSLSEGLSAPALSYTAFRSRVWDRGLARYRDLPWRQTRDPYAIWVSEVMLQQTQVVRVDGRWQRWLERFPSLETLASASTADVLQEWQGMGYNRRALALKRAAELLVQRGATFPEDERTLLELPGIGPATAAGIRAFAFDLPGVYLETNVRSVFLHELFPQEESVSDRALKPLVAAACPQQNARGWYFALLDYGAWLKHTVPNPSRRSASHARQSVFEGSHRQKRAQVLRALLQTGEKPVSADIIAQVLTAGEWRGTSESHACEKAQAILTELSREGFCTEHNDKWHA